jgi:rhamnosyltransferase
MGPRFLIVLCTHQGERFLGPQLASLAGQTYRDWALEIHDWASRDGTRALLADFCAKHAGSLDITVTLHEDAPGPCASFMHAVRASLERRRDFDWLVFSDQDDVWLPDKLAALARVWRAEPDLDLIYSDFAVIDAQGRVLADRCLRPGGAWGRAMNITHPVALWLNVVRGMSMAVSRAFLERWSAAWHHPDWFMHDWAMCIVAHLVQARVRFLPESLAQYRRHSGNATMAAWGWRKFLVPWALLRQARRYVLGVYRQYHSLPRLVPSGWGGSVVSDVTCWKVARTVWSGRVVPWTVAVQVILAFILFWPRTSRSRVPAQVGVFRD